MQQAGGLVALGTDSPLVAPGIALHTGLRAGGLAYSNHQALQNVTINAAKMAFVDKDLGTVEVGKVADLTIVRGDPVADLKNAAKVEYVMKNGVTYTQAQILAPFKTPLAMSARAQGDLRLHAGVQPQSARLRSGDPRRLKHHEVTGPRASDRMPRALFVGPIRAARRTTTTRSAWPGRSCAPARPQRATRKPMLLAALAGVFEPRAATRWRLQ